MTGLALGGAGMFAVMYATQAILPVLGRDFGVSPSRAGLMTGRYQQRFGHEFNPENTVEALEGFGLSLEERTLPECRPS